MHTNESRGGSPYIRLVRNEGLAVNEPGGILFVPTRLDRFASEGVRPAVCAVLVDFEEAPEGFFQALERYGSGLRILMPTAHCPTLVIAIPFRPHPNSAGDLIGTLRSFGFTMRLMLYKPGQFVTEPLATRI